MRNIMAAMCLSVLLALSACGQASAPAEEQADEMITAEELGLPATMELEFVAAEQVQAAPATLQIGEGYSIYGVLGDLSSWKEDCIRHWGLPRQFRRDFLATGRFLPKDS